MCLSVFSWPSLDFAFFFEKCYLLSMPTEKPKIIFVADTDLLKRLDDFRYGNRIPTKSEAIRRLLQEALEKYENKSTKQGDENHRP